MNSIDLTEQVWAQLQHYAERIAYLQSIGDDKSAEVLISSGELMAEAPNGISSASCVFRTKESLMTFWIVGAIIICTVFRM